jgi:hypothetical protein
MKTDDGSAIPTTTRSHAIAEFLMSKGVFTRAD